MRDAAYTEAMQRMDTGQYLGEDFETWVDDIAQAHRFIYGAALMACWERFRRIGVCMVPTS